MSYKPKNDISDDELELILESLEWFNELSDENQNNIKEIFYALILRVQSVETRLKNIEERMTSLDTHMASIFSLFIEKKKFH